MTLWTNTKLYLWQVLVTMVLPSPQWDVQGVLQVGLAVGDIDQMKKFATVRRLAMQIEYQIEIEEAYPSFIINRVYQEVYVEKPNKYSRRNRYGRKTF